MVGVEEIDADFLATMQRFREWAVRVAAEHENPDWVMPVGMGRSWGFAFSLEAYNYFAEHASEKTRSARDEDELYEMLKRHSKHLYKSGEAARLENSKFFILPDRILVLNFKTNK